MYNSMPSLIPNIPISFIKPKHPNIFTYIIFRKNNPDNTCNKSSKQSIKQCTHSRTCSGEGLASLKQRALAQARHATVGNLWTLAQARPSRLSETGRRSKRELVAWASVRGRTIGEPLIFSSRRDELAWARISDLSHCSTHET